MVSDRDGRALALTDDRGTESLASYLRSLTDSQLFGHQNTVDGHECRLYKSSAYPFLMRSRKSPSIASMWRSNWAKWLIKPARMNIRTSLLKVVVRPKVPASLWQYSDKWMTGPSREKLMWLREQMQQTSQCWTLKELAKNIWDRPWSTERRNDWLQWISLASECDVPMMKNAAKTIKRLYGILNAMRHRVSNGNAEALNSRSDC